MALGSIVAPLAVGEPLVVMKMTEHDIGFSVLTGY
jgi:hypothetical protein